MKQFLDSFSIHLLHFGLVLIAGGVFSSVVSAQVINVAFSSANVDITSGAGTVDATIDITITNFAVSPLPVAGYSFFLEIEPPGGSLPTGVTFGTPAANYASGNGAGFLLGANIDGTLNLTPAAGDLGLGQIQFFDAALANGDSEVLLTVNLVIDRATAVAGDYIVSLSNEGQNSISSTSGSEVFTSTTGTLTLSADQFLLGDVDLSGAVNFLDISPFISLLSMGGFQDEADIDRSGGLNFLDISPFIAILSGS